MKLKLFLSILCMCFALYVYPTDEIPEQIPLRVDAGIEKNTAIAHNNRTFFSPEKYIAGINSTYQKATLQDNSTFQNTEQPDFYRAQGYADGLEIRANLDKGSYSLNLYFGNLPTTEKHEYDIYIDVASGSKLLEENLNIENFKATRWQHNFDVSKAGRIQFRILNDVGKVYLAGFEVIPFGELPFELLYPDREILMDTLKFEECLNTNAAIQAQLDELIKGPLELEIFSTGAHRVDQKGRILYSVTYQIGIIRKDE